MRQPSTISVIIPTVNAYEELDLAIASIKKNSDCQIDFCIIVDPDMNTGKVNSKILQVCARHQVKAWVNKKNLGPYGNWNRGAEVARTDWLVFATDDQYFPPHWDHNLVKYWQPKRLVSGRLVEPGIIPVYRTNIKKDFGVLPSEFKEKEFNAWCAARPDQGFVKDGFFIPMLQHRSDFDALGHYPTAGKFGTSTAVSNDVLYVRRALEKGYEFGTASDSYSYHFQASSWKKKTLKPNLAAIVLTKNEELDLPVCLRSLAWVNKIIVVDSGSTDKTVAIAKKFGARVYRHQFTDFSSQRNFALSKAVKYDWVLMVDADEVVEKSLARELKSFAKDIYLDGVKIPRKNYIFGRWIKHTDWYPDYHLVFFRPKIVRYRGDVHELAQFTKGNQTVAIAKGHLLHHNYDTTAEFIRKNFLDYPQLAARRLNAAGHRFRPRDLVLAPVQEFFQRFFQAEGYRDGVFGLLLSLLMAGSVLTQYAYLWELQGKSRPFSLGQVRKLFGDLRLRKGELAYWLTTVAIEDSHGLNKFFYRLRRKLIKQLIKFQK